MSLIGLLGRGFGTTGSIAAPDTPTIAASDNGDGTATVTISGSTAGTTNTVKIAANGGAWATAGSRSGNGDASISVSAGVIAIVVVSSNAGGSAISNPVWITINAFDSATRSLLAKVAEQMSLAIETKRQAGGFTINSFASSWDFMDRVFRRDLSDDTTYVRVLIPTEYADVSWYSRSKQLEFVAVWHIEVWRKLKEADHEDGTTQVDRDQIDQLTLLTEQLHQLFAVDSNELTVSEYRVLWNEEHDGVRGKSKTSPAYVPDLLADERVFVSLCNEIFVVTE